MPLHLLQHKSWHVGSIQNQERVRRDERNAKLKEEEEERRMQEIDAEKRMTLLRKQLVNSQGDEEATQELSRLLADEIDQRGALAIQETPTDAGTTEWGRRDRTKKRRRGEEDEGPPPATSLTEMKHTSSSAPLTDAAGHINLFPVAAMPKSISQNPEYLADKKREEKSFEAQYTMQLTRPSAPWYANIDNVSQKDKEKTEKRREKDARVEGRVREEQDPMKAMGQGLKKMREVNEERERERKRRDAEVGLGADERIVVSSRNEYSKRDSRRDRSRSPQRRERERGRRKRDREESPRRRRHSRDRKGRSRSPLSRSRSRSPRRRKEHRDKSLNSGNSSMSKLRDEAAAREAAERRKAKMLVEKEQKFRAPETWTASSVGGRGRYSRQFGS